MEQQRTDGLDTQAVLRGVWRRHKRLVTALFLGLAIPGLLVVYRTSQSLYVSTAMISIESSPLDSIPFFKDIPRKDNIASQLALLKSRSLSEGVIEALPKESFEELLANSQHTDYMFLITNRIKAWLGKPVTVLSPQQRALAEISNARMEFLQSLDAVGIITIKGTASSPRVAMDLVNSYIQALLGRTRNVNQEDAQKARQFLETQMQQAKDNLAQAEETLTKYQQQKGRIRLGTQTEFDLVKLSQNENALAEAQASHEVLTVRIAAMRQVLNQTRPKDTKTADAPEKADAPAGTSSPDSDARFVAFKAAQERLARLEAKLSNMRERFTEGHPSVQVTQEEVIQEQARVAQLAKGLPPVPVAKAPRGNQSAPQTASDRDEAQRQLVALELEEASLQSKVESLRLQVGRLRGALKNVNQEELEFNNLRRSVESQRNMLTVLSDKLMSARMREQGESAVIRIIDPASYPIQPSQSKTQQMLLMVLAMSAGVAFGGAFALEFWRQPVETEEDVRKATTLQVLGSVGHLSRSQTEPARHEHSATPSLPVSHPTAPSSPGPIYMELYRAIRANLEAERLKTPFFTLLVTSAGPGEGKSTTVLNLAHVFKEFGRRVLVIEADLRRPTFSRSLALSAKPGLLDLLNGSASLEEARRQLPSGVHVIPAQVAREDPAALLGSQKFFAFLNSLAGQYDLVLIDSAPVLAVPDNLLLAPAIDQVILIAKASATSKRDLSKAAAILTRVNARILGVVVNQANPMDVHYYDPQYRKYYRPAEPKAATPAASSRFAFLSKKPKRPS